jgi:hypothetical protein
MKDVYRVVQLDKELGRQHGINTNACMRRYSDTSIKRGEGVVKGPRYDHQS